MKVTLIEATRRPIFSAYVASENMVGNVMTLMSEVSEPLTRIVNKVVSLGDSKLAGPLEFVHFTFQVEDVPRWFTHQLVRTRVGVSYSQVSLRFNDPTEGGYKIHVPLGLEDEMVDIFNVAVDVSTKAYQRLVEMGLPREEARGLLPMGTLTTIGVNYSLKTLMALAETRMCHQAQPIWVEFMKQVRAAIRSYYLTLPTQEDVVPNDEVADVLCRLLVRSCDRYGRCTFKSMYDRDCPVREARGY